MTPQTLQALIANGEDTRHQFKAVVQRPLPSPGNAEKAESKAESEADSEAESLEVRVLHALQRSPLGKAKIAEALGMRQATGQLNEQVRALLGQGLIAMTVPDKPNSRLQQYRLTPAGMQWLATAHKPAL